MVDMIVNADDFGISKEVNCAIDYCIRQKLISRTTIMTNMPFYYDAVESAKNGNYMDRVGLHINLTEGVPITENIKHTTFCSNGEFNGTFFKKKYNRLFLSKKLKKIVSEEIEAQIQIYLKSGFKLLHADSHQHIHNNVSILFIILSLLKKYNFKSLRLSRNIPRLSFLKKIYKGYINNKISNKKFGDDVVYFGSMDDYSILFKTNIKPCKCELMVHPILKGNKILDTVSNNSLVEWSELNHRFMRIKQ